MRLGVRLLAIAAVLMLSAAAFARTTRTYVERGGTTTYLQHPVNLSFSVDGDLEGLNLRWKHWGAGYTIARGDIYERQGYPTYSSRTVRGAIKLDHRRSCDGARYYTRAVFYPYEQLLFKAGPIRLYTPCTGG